MENENILTQARFGPQNPATNWFSLTLLSTCQYRER